MAAPCKTTVTLRRRPVVLQSMMKSALFLSLLLSIPVVAQTRPATKRPASSVPFNYSAPKIIGRTSGFRLEGTASEPARISSPQLSVVAPVIAFDLSGNSASPLSQVRTSGGVSLRVNAPARGSSPKTTIESKSQSATLTAGSARTYTLRLEGNLSGFYQVGDGPKSTLSGEVANLQFGGGDFTADLQNPNISIPAETLSPGRPDALGELRVSAQRGQISQSGGTATFSGQARAVSSGGGAPFDLSATSFIVSRAPDGTLSTLRAQGKTTVKYDLPPEPNSAQPVSPGANSIGKPTHVEVTSDGAVFDRATSKATFSGQVRGFYRLQSASGARDFPFSGDRAVISFDPKAASTQGGLNVEITGVPGGPGSIDAPAFEF